MLLEALRPGEDRLGPGWRVDFITPARCRRGYLGFRHDSGFALVKSKISMRDAFQQLVQDEERYRRNGVPLREIRKLRRQPWWIMVNPDGHRIASFGGGPDVACAQAERVMTKAIEAMP
jgi:hypothetical protein